MDLDPRTKLRTNNGVEIPIIGLGTYRSGIGKQTREAVKYALEAGYRHIDTASVYGNERDVADGFRLSGLQRDDVFITTKIWNSDQGYERTLKAVDRSLRTMKLDHVDLLLMHWPLSGQRIDTWRAMEKVLDEGKARSIGVCNFTIHHLEELLESSRVSPAVNQVEFSPFLNQVELKTYSDSHNILVQGYSPLTKGMKLRDPEIASVAREIGRTPAQVMIRWALQNGLITLPKSTKKERIKENLDVFDFSLDRSAMEHLNSLDQGLRTGWDPTTEP